MVRLLLEKGANADSRDELGKTPLYWAGMRGHETVTKLLLENSPDAIFKDGANSTLLLCAVLYSTDARA
jgi:ankyrin repeat protein